MKENLILVDSNDNPIGDLDKIIVHQQGILHRAFSIFIFNTKGELLLQQRSDKKYHSANKWSNTCCSHPIVGEDMELTLHRRLFEEMGLHCNLRYCFVFKYLSHLENNMIENEIDYIYMGISNDIPKPSKDEVKNWCYMNLKELESNLHLNENQYTIWLNLVFNDIKNYYNTNILKKIN